VLARWVPRQLTAELKLVWRFEREGDDFHTRLVTGDETWIHYHIPETESEHGMASFFIPKTKEVSDTTICREGYACSLLGPKKA
jgi:hypothetical protein